MKHSCAFLLLWLGGLLAVNAQTTFVYRGQTLTISERALLVEAEADSARLAQSAYVYRSVREALRAAEGLQQSHAYTEAEPLCIYIAPSVYWLDNPDDPDVRKPRPGESTPFGMELTLSHLRLIGLADRPEDVVLACNRGQTQGAEGNFTMLHLTGNDIQVENLTFGNYCSVDLEYPLNPSLNRKKRAEAIVQAQLIICRSDKVVARNCRFISRLNSCPFSGAERALFYHCYFECTDDALCERAVYLRCRFTLFSGKPFYSTRGTGAVFLDCDLHALTGGRQYLVKVGSPVAMVDCRWTSRQPNLFIGWTQDPTDDLRSYQHNLTLNGQPLLVNADKPWLTVDMTGKPILKAYRLCDADLEAGDASIPYNVYNLLRGNDGWDPLRQASVHGNATASAPDCRPHIPTQLSLSARAATVDLEADIVPNAFGGIGIQHTGSVGASATLLRRLDVQWEEAY
ncbi:MAG: hypothetical protein Q4D56_15355 [Bacteroides sp.]|nr:hypothetical protein [Bacteroides sp.]